MPAYFVADSDVTDAEEFKKYAAGVGATLQAHGAKVLVASGDVETKEGAWAPKRLIVLQFADRAALNAWYDSPEYQAILPHRLNATKGSAVFVDGVG